ncbi:MAG: radical SAM family heme chaperone HemW [Phascolarctobacterium sp.]|nr:radical SAM family heme chaperone HemW [Phascolarctobacterium sp.]
MGKNIAGLKNKRELWQRAQGIYVHIPFCLQKCLYCDFISFTCPDREIMDTYADAVCREIAAGGKMEITESPTVYFGGGTPSLLPETSLAKIADELQKHGMWDNLSEKTIEANPGTVNLEKLRFFRRLGFNRISFGVQSLNDGELKAIGRIHTAEEAREALNMAEKAGFDNINADIMYGLPGQDAESLRQTVKGVIGFNLGHISAYGLTLEENTSLARLAASKTVIIPSDDDIFAMYSLLQEMLEKEGYRRYEISNYAKNGRIARHNTVYWHYFPYLGFGTAACSFDGEKRWTGTASVMQYITQARRNDFSYDTEYLTQDEKIGEFMFLGLRMAEGVDLKEAEKRFGIDIMEKFARETASFLDQELLIHDAAAGRLRLSRQGMAVGNRIFEIFVKI